MAKIRIGRDTVEVNATILDRMISYIAPVHGARRHAARTALALAGGYHGGSRTRRAGKEYIPHAADAASDILPDLPLLRARSRDLVRNAPLATGAVNGVVTSVIGPGLIPQSRIDRNVLEMTDEQADQWQAATEREWKIFSKHCDVERTIPFPALQNLAFRSALESGDCFILLTRIPRPESPYQTKIQLIEADRVCNPNRTVDTQTLMDGVEVDSSGAPLAYHVCSLHPGNLRFAAMGKWTAIPAFSPSGRRNILHLFSKIRIGQVRGVPYLSPVIETLKEIDRYTEAEITAAVISGLFSVFVTSSGVDSPLNPFVAPGGSGSTPVSSSSSPDEMKLGPGLIAELGPGQSVVSANPGRPNTAFEPFMLAILRQIGVALELPFEVLNKHFTASYSAARAALLEAWKFYNDRRAWAASALCDPVWEAFLDEAVAMGRVSAPGYFADPIIRQAYLGVQWIGPGKGMIDEEREINAAEKRIALGVSTHAEVTAEFTGKDWDANIAQLRRENALKREAFPSAQAPAPSPEKPDQQGTVQEDAADTETGDSEKPDQEDQ